MAGANDNGRGIDGEGDRGDEGPDWSQTPN
jgi:hypothetical protein